LRRFCGFDYFRASVKGGLFQQQKMAKWGHFFYGQAHYDEPEVASPASIPRTHMYDLHKPFNNPFDDVGISMNALLAFTTDHQGRMANNNTGGFLTARIAATQTAFTPVNTAFQSDQGKLGERKTAKQAKTAYRVTLREGASKIQTALENKYGKKSPLIATFFPTGLGKFNKVADDQVTNAWTTLIAALTAHQGELGAQIVTDATALKTGWVAVYTPSESASGAKDSTMEAKKAARQALQLELFKNWLTIALQFPRQPEKLDVYMQQSLLEPNNPTSTPPTPPTPTPPGP
jgi:hypothetical protein